MHVHDAWVCVVCQQLAGTHRTAENVEPHARIPSMYLQVQLPIDMFTCGEEYDSWYDLETDLSEGDDLEMVVGVLGAENLMAADRGGTSDPYVVGQVRSVLSLSLTRSLSLSLSLSLAHTHTHTQTHTHTPSGANGVLFSAQTSGVGVKATTKARRNICTHSVILMHTYGHTFSSETRRSRQKLSKRL